MLIEKTAPQLSAPRAGRRRGPLAAVIAGASLATAIGTFGFAVVPASASPTHLVVSRAETGLTQHLAVGLDKSMIIDLPRDVSEVIVSQPTIASAVMHTRRRAVIQGTGVGDTNIFFLDAHGAQISVLDVSITKDASALSSTIARVLPGSRIHVQTFGTHIVLSGAAQSQDDVAKATAIASQFAGGAANVASVIKVTGAQQVKLKVTVAEVSREAVKALGINLSASLGSGSLTTGLVSTQPLGGASGVVTNNALTAGVNVPNLSLQATLHALERRGAMRTLDQPTLTALSGQPAEFMSGGQFPVPSGIDANGTVSFTFKQYGVSLKFTPTVKSDGIIGLVVDTDVSEQTTDGGFSEGGLTIPATKERQAKTSVELPAGSTLSIAGLMQDTTRQQMNSLPGVSQIPIIGALFRSRDYIHDRSELVILVTPYLATSGPMPALPTDAMTTAGDAEANFLGHMEQLYGVGDRAPDRTHYHGHVGFVLD